MRWRITVCVLVAACAWALGISAAQAGGAVVPIPEFKRWEQNMVRYGQKHFDARSKGLWEGAVWYYDGQRVFYQISDYTKDKKWLIESLAVSFFM